MYYVHVVQIRVFIPPDDGGNRLLQNVGTLIRAMWHYIPENHNLVCMYISSSLQGVWIMSLKSVLFISHLMCTVPIIQPKWGWWDYQKCWIMWKCVCFLGGRGCKKHLKWNGNAVYVQIWFINSYATLRV
jgi:hypothetical protein